jgi:hypothetical protein
MTSPGRQPGVNRNVWLALGVGSVFGILILVGQLLLIGQIFNGRSSTRYASGTAGATRIQCSPVESLATHYHVALLIHRNGGTDVLPAQTGINTFCLYWIHVHDDSGIVHVEAPAAYRDHAFVLADVFAVAKTRFDANHLGSASFPGTALSVYVDGVKWSGSPGDVPLVDLQTIDVVAPGESFSYLPYDWPSGFQPPPTALNRACGGRLRETLNLALTSAPYACKPEVVS